MCLEVGRKILNSLELPDIIETDNVLMDLKIGLWLICCPESDNLDLDCGSGPMEERWTKVAIPRLLLWVEKSWKMYGPLSIPESRWQWVGEAFLAVLCSAEKDNCSICLSSLYGEKSESCGHRFHSECLQGWKHAGNNTCPLCRHIL